jgi:hypothetical protein
MEVRRIPKRFLAYNPKKEKNIWSPQLSWRDQYTLQEDETDQA